MEGPFKIKCSLKRESFGNYRFERFKEKEEPEEQVQQE